MFSLWGCERDKIQLFIKEVNKHHATIKFTAEISEKEINFLDTTIFKGERSHNDHVSRNGLLLCVQFVFTTLNNSLLFLVPVKELSRELRVINYNLRKIVGMTNLPFR